MATLYTPEARTQGLDWLAGMVQNSQQLWQRERQLELEAKRLQASKKQAELQNQQFWAQQARLAEQDEFQKRKFIYGVADDTRKFEWDQSKAKMDFGLRERGVNLQAQQEERLTEGQKWDMDPNNPANQYRAAATVGAQVNAAQDLQQMQEDAAPAQWGAPFLPTDGEPTTGPSANLLPDMNKPDGVRGTGFVPSGNPYAPGTVTTPSGQQMEMIATSVDKKGRPTSYSPRAISSGGDQRKALRDEIDDLQDNFRSTVAAKESLPSALPPGSSPEEIAAYSKRVAAVEQNNQLLQRQADTISRDLKVREAQSRMMDVKIDNMEVTPKFANIAPSFIDAFQRRDPVGLGNLRVQIKPLADDGDPAAKKALGIINDVLGEKPDEKKGKTGYF